MNTSGSCQHHADIGTRMPINQVIKFYLVNTYIYCCRIVCPPNGIAILMWHSSPLEMCAVRDFLRVGRSGVCLAGRHTVRAGW